MRQSSPARSLLFAAGSFALAACATTEEPIDQVAERTTSPASDCFSVTRADDFRLLDERNLIVSTIGTRAYHVELSHGCFGLRGSNAIALRSRTDQICGFAGDMVIVDGGIPEQCSVLSVRSLEEDEVQILVDQFDPDASSSAIEVEVAELPDDAQIEGDERQGEGADGQDDGPEAQTDGAGAAGDSDGAAEGD